MPVRITAITKTIELTYASFGWLETERDRDSNVILWSVDYSCTYPMMEGVVLAHGESHETFLCFRARVLEEEKTIPDRPFVHFNSLDGDTLRAVALVRTIVE